MNVEREVARIFASVKPKKVILFGSRASGEHDSGSDVDLFVVYRTEKRFLDRLAELYALWDLPVAVDILAYTPEEFAEMIRGSAFVAEAVSRGRVILEAA